ncbi:hypothetical protein EKO17_21210 [Enterobacter hormaechei subsp. xiangfangensis]|uniref:hypothetical protein n=1 Tax=Enterobacter hormaechei TaxID=158836 RepID=UPI000F821715|nr:hypothetical protein [Enterobacter hormaechei]RTM58807.1 hypothetical protein EKO17_21210 [Enterobacter hormaechei subsp. xiangfangensis]
MALSIMERLALGKELSGLMQEQKSASVMQRMTIGKHIVEVMIKLGLGAAAEPRPEEVLAPELPPEPEDAPQVVKDFLAGVFTKVSQMEFIDTLRAIAEYIGQHLTLDQAKEQTALWVAQNGYTD